MLAVICLFVPALIWVFARSILLPSEKKDCRWVWEYLFCFLLLNGGIFALLRAFFKSGSRPIYYLNHSPRYAIKYFALALVLIVLELVSEKIFTRQVAALRDTISSFAKKLTPYLRKIEHIFRRGYESLANRYRKVRRGTNAVVFTVCFVALFCLVGSILQPIWFEWNNYNTTRGIYKEPSNTIQTVFLGTSTIVNGIIPIELYKNYGICAYNLATEQQSMIASYFLLKEAYKLQSMTLNTVMLDPPLVSRVHKDAFYHKAFDAMKTSLNKIQAVKAYSNDLDETFLKFFPLFSYHERWESFTGEDFKKGAYAPELYTRGYNFTIQRRLEKVSKYTDIRVPLYYADETAEEQKLEVEDLYYLKKIIEFCKEKNLLLVLFQAPRGWSSGMHNAVQKIADKYQLEFIDFNIEPYYSEIGYNFGTDSVDNSHPNYYGALKLTNYLGEYLVNKCGNKDVRGDPAYGFMKKELADYKRAIAPFELEKIQNPCDYIEYAQTHKDYVVFISVKDNAAGRFRKDQIAYFRKKGLNALADLGRRDSYLAVIDNGKIVVEKTQKDPETLEKENADETAIINDMERIEDLYRLKKQKQKEESKKGLLSDPTITIDDLLSKELKYTIVSGGYNLGNRSSIKINNKEYSKNLRGLNVVLYDKRRKKVIDYANFDTSLRATRPAGNYEQRFAELKYGGTASYHDIWGKDLLYYLYNRNCALQKRIAELKRKGENAALLTYLESFWNEEGTTMYLSVKDDAATKLTEPVREALSTLGLKELSKLKYRESYLAIIQEGKVLLEEKNQGDTPIQLKLGKVRLASGGLESDNTASIVIEGIERSRNETGINLVIYDNWTDSIITSAVFDTNSTTPFVKD